MARFNPRSSGGSAKPEDEAGAFNIRHAVGQRVRYWKGACEGEPTGVARTSTKASVLGGHTAVVWLEGVSGCVALTHIEPLEPWEER